MDACACRGERYMEVDIDVASSSVASTVVGMVQVGSPVLDLPIPGVCL